MYIVSEGSYKRDRKDVVSCGVVSVTKNGFLNKSRYEARNIWADAQFAEWFAFDKALEELKNADSSKVTIFTNSKEIVNVYNNKVQFVKDGTIEFLKSNNHIEPIVRYILSLLEKLSRLENEIYRETKRSVIVNVKNISDLNDEEDIEVIKKCYSMADKLSNMVA